MRTTDREKRLGQAEFRRHHSTCLPWFGTEPAKVKQGHVSDEHVRRVHLVACALGQKAWRDGCSAFYRCAVALFRDPAVSRADGSLRSLLARLSRIDVLVIGDWAMAPLAETERRNFWEICEDRYQTRSTILTSPLPVARWHDQVGDPTGRGILDRLVYNAHRIAMRGDSMHEKRGHKAVEPATCETICFAEDRG